MPLNSIVQVLATSYSGTTLLDAILDAQPCVSGLGEVAQLWEKKDEGIRRGPCHKCGLVAQECEYWKDWFLVNENKLVAKENPYEYALRKSIANVLIDTSKATERMHDVPASLQKRILVLTKSPHEWAYSVIQHAKHTDAGYETLPTVEECFIHWRNHHSHFLSQAYSSNGSLSVTYRDLTTDPEKTISQICMWLGVGFDPGPIRSNNFWNRRSHALGGNPAVIDQSANRKMEMAGGREGWLNGKYRKDSRWRKIRYDDNFLEDEEFLDEAYTAYGRCDQHMRNLLARFGYGNIKSLRNEL